MPLSSSSFERRLCIREVRVAPVDKQVARLEGVFDAGNGCVNWLASRDHHHDPTWAFQGVQEIIQVLHATRFLPGYFDSKGFDLFLIQIVPGHTETVTFHVERQHDVPSHPGP